MIINYNIFNIILDKLALNKWKNKMKIICSEYDKTFYRNNYFNLVHNSNCIICGGSFWMIFDDNTTSGRTCIYSLIKCRFCSKKILLPKNY